VRHLDLFSGIGGFALAARWVGWETVAFCESDPYCQQVLEKHWPGVPIYPDVRKLYRCTDSMVACPAGCDEPWCELCGDHYFQCECIGPANYADDVGWVDVITAGFPCQDISLMQEVSDGGREGIEGERSGLWSEAARLICELRPTFAVLENVTALAIRGLDRVAGDLAEVGYGCEWHCIPAAYAGAPHLRDRIFIVAHADDAGLQGHARYGDGIRRSLAPGPATAGRIPPGGDAEGWWLREPGLDRVVDGIPARVDRTKAIGNAIVPQIAAGIFRAIEEAA
jgi:DNA (cytosine-5)-methyltransferase 1